MKTNVLEDLKVLFKKQQDREPVAVRNPFMAE
jgi:hypothetical protein